MIQNITPDGQFHKKQIKENWKIIGVDKVHITKENFAWSFETITHQEECVLIFGISLHEHEISFIDGEIESWGVTSLFIFENCKCLDQLLAGENMSSPNRLKRYCYFVTIQKICLVKFLSSTPLQHFCYLLKTFLWSCCDL